MTIRIHFCHHFTRGCHRDSSGAETRGHGGRGVGTAHRRALTVERLISDGVVALHTERRFIYPERKKYLNLFTDAEGGI